MSETQAASSPAEVTDVFNGETPTLAEYQHYRDKGELPERFKPQAESAPADPPKEDEPEPEQAEPAPESDPDDEPQEQPHKGSGAEKRIKQLLAKQKELERKLAEVAQKGGTSDSPSAQAQPRQPQTYQEYRQSFKPSAFIEEYAKAHPEATYEDANAAMADHLLDVRDHFRNIETRVNAEKQALEAKVSEARERYEDFDEIKESFLAMTVSDKGTPLIPLPVLGIINDSDVLPDLLYTLGSDEAELAKFVAMAKANPNKAIRYVAKVESLIAEELAKPKETPARGEDGKFKSQQAPEPKRTSAPKPPSPVGGTSRGTFDVNDETTDINDWLKKRQEQLSRR